MNDDQKIKLWLLITFVMLAFMALFSSLGSFFIRVFFIAALISLAQVIRFRKGKASAPKRKEDPYKDYTSRQHADRRASEYRKSQLLGVNKPINKVVDKAKLIPRNVIIFVSVGAFIVFCFMIAFSSESSYHDEDMAYYLSTGDQFYEKGQYDSAYFYFRKATQYDPQSTDALFRYGNVLYTRNDPDSAIYYYDKVLASDREYYDAWYNKAWVYRERKKLDLSNQALKLLLEKNPDYLVARELLGDNYYDQRNYAEAKRLYLEAWPDDEYNVALNQRLGELIPGEEGEVYRQRGSGNQ